MIGILRVAATLAGVAVVATALVAGSKELTESAIRDHRTADRLGRIEELIPPQRYDNRMLEDTVRIRDSGRLGTEEPVTVYRAREDGEPVAVAFRVVAPEGYNGAIELLVAIETEGRLLGVRVLDHRETPGLGDGIESRKSDWVAQFAGHGLGNPPAEDWDVAQDGGGFDALTGATITSRAVIRALRRALELFQLRKKELFASKNEQEGR